MPKIITTGDGKRLIDTGLPQRQIKPIWVEMHKELNLKIMDAVLNSNPTTSRVKKAISFSISQILDYEIRAQIRNSLAEKITEIEKKQYSNEATADAIEDAYIEAFESVSDYLDTAFGISHRIAIGGI